MSITDSTMIITLFCAFGIGILIGKIISDKQTKLKKQHFINVGYWYAKAESELKEQDRLLSESKTIQESDKIVEIRDFK